MMNDPTVLEASRVLAATLLQEKTNDKDKLIKAFRLIVCRTPEEKELDVLTKYYERQKGMVNEQTAEKTLSVGEYPIPKNIDRKTLAALMRVISAIYNLEETIMKT
jgi:hypothetical protein